MWPIYLSQKGLLNPPLHDPGKLGVAVYLKLSRDDGRADDLRGIDDLLDSGDP